MVFDNSQGFMDSGQAALEQLFPVQLEVDGVVMAAAGSGARVSKEADVGGYLDDGLQRVRVRKSLLEQVPELHARVTANGEQMRLVAVAERPWDICWTLELEPLRS